MIADEPLKRICAGVWLKRLAARMPLTLVQDGDPNLLLTDVCENSRAATERAIFVAIRGAKSDGHDYLAAAYAQGCRCFLVQSLPDGVLLPDALVAQVADTRCALAYLAADLYGNPADKLTLVGITGTKGKTTTALMTYRLLEEMGVRAGYIGTEGAWFAGQRIPTANTTPGPLILHRLLSDMVRSGVTVAVLEVSSQSVMQHRVEGLSFDVGVFTNLSPDHISPTEHPTFEHYRDCKRDFLLRGISRRGVLLLNGNDPHAAYMAKDASAQIRTYGIENEGEFDLTATQPLPILWQGAPAVRFICEGEEVVLSMPGEYNVSNALCAVGILSALGYRTQDVLWRLESVRVPGRLEALPAPPDCSVLVDYAHNGVSLRAVLMTLRPYTQGRLICLVGSVGGRTQMRRADLGDAAAQYADLTVLTADNPDFEDPRIICEEMARSFTARGQDNYLIVPDREQAIRHALRIMAPGDVLLLAGKGCEQYQLIRGERVPFCEREIVAQVLREALREALLV